MWSILSDRFAVRSLRCQIASLSDDLGCLIAGGRDRMAKKTSLSEFTREEYSQGETVFRLEDPNHERHMSWSFLSLDSSKDVILLPIGVTNTYHIMDCTVTQTSYDDVMVYHVYNSDPHKREEAIKKLGNLIGALPEGRR